MIVEQKKKIDLYYNYNLIKICTCRFAAYDLRLIKNLDAVDAANNNNEKKSKPYKIRY